MADYNFLNLSPREFEELSRDLLQEYLGGVYFESFKEGVDGGIDFICSINKENTIIVQCKRYSNIKDLMQNLKKECEKAKKLNPKRYILTTSVDLNQNEKNKIIEMFEGIIKDSTDIFGKDDLNNLLGQYDHVEKRHHKLWLSSVSILNKLINNSTINRSTSIVFDVMQDIQLFVQNEGLIEALDILKLQNYVIISGMPGIGKTTLTKMLIFEYIAQDFELVDVSVDIEEAETNFLEDKKQIFYYDDFLGSNFLEDRLEKKEDARLVNFIKKIMRTSDKKLIMSTREYILNQAKIKYSALKEPVIDLNRCILDLQKYSILEKAKILYNHLFFSQTPQESIESILKDKRYLDIINHNNYNPRLIEYMTFHRETYNADSGNYYANFMHMLNNPEEIWVQAFENQITEISRYLLYILLAKDSISKELLQESLEKLVQIESKRFDIQYSRWDFRNSLKELEGTFINIILKNDKHIVSFHNPSIRDFLINHVGNQEDLIISIIQSAVVLEQLLDVFYIGEKWPFAIRNKILLSDRVSNILEKKISEEYSFYLCNNKQNITYELKILSKLEDFFDIKKHEKIRGIILDNISKFKIEWGMDSGDKKEIIYLNKSVTEYSCVDWKLLMDDFVQSMWSLEDIELLVEMRKWFPNEYLELKEDINESIEYVIGVEYDNVGHDLDQIESLIESIENVEKDFEVSFSYVKGNLYEKYDETPFRSDTKDSTNIREIVAPNNRESIALQIEVMFKGLKSK